MVNLERKPLEKIDIRVKAEGIKQVESIENGNIQFTQDKGYHFQCLLMGSLTLFF